MKSLQKIALGGALLAFVSFFLQTAIVSASVACTNLTSDASYGMTDSYSGGPITSLQDFLVAKGYMNASPNGHFGPATLAAVIAFQSANAIPATGYVGALTRTAIGSLSCAAPAAAAGAAPASSNNPAPSANVTAPLSGSTLSIGQDYTITWNGINKNAYTIVLEDPNGLSQGFITPNSQISGSYSWQVGTVLSGATNSYATVPTGTYQIHLESVSGSAPDIWSGKFTIVAPPLSVNAVIPLTVSASQNPTMVVYGSGFSSSARVNVDGYYNFPGTVLYASPDGTILVFSLPSGLATGAHVIDVSNIYGSLSTSPSFTVTQ